MLYHRRRAQKFSGADARRCRLRPLARRIKDIVCRCSIFLSHEHPITAGVECNIKTVATNRIRLDHGINACRLEGALCEIRFPLVAECLHDDKLGFAHLLNLTPEIEPQDVNVAVERGPAVWGLNFSAVVGYAMRTEP
jgi:hypothetical protein